MKAYAPWVMMAVMIPSFPAQAVNVSGTIGGPVTWSQASSPYVVIGDITVATNGTLTIEPGVTVQVNHYLVIDVYGRLEAAGTSSSNIVFTGSTQSNGWWYGLRLYGTGSVSLAWCDLSYAGYSGANGIDKQSTGSLSMSHSRLHHINNAALYQRNSANAPVLNNVCFSNNTYGIRVGVNASIATTNSAFADNTYDVYADGGTLTQPVVWTVQSNYSLWLGSALNVASNASLTVSAGTVVKFPQYTYIDVYGQLIAAGTASDRVYFTDNRDDTVGGDANHNTTNSVPAPYWWYGISTMNTGSIRMAQAEVRYGGYNSRYGVRKQAAGSLALTNCVITRTSGDGLVVDAGGGTTSLSGVQIISNEYSGLYLSAGQINPVNCVFGGNAMHGLYQELNASANVTNNAFWGNGTAPMGVGGGTLTNQLILRKAGADPFVIRSGGNVTIATNGSLAIHPGITMEMPQYRWLENYGQLNAIGTSNAPIRFAGTTPNAGWWYYLKTMDPGRMALEWCEVVHAGYSSGYAVRRDGSGSLTVRNCRIHDNSGTGLWLSPGGALTTEHNSYSNQTYAIRVDPGASILNDTYDFSNNTYDVYANSGTIAQPVTWALTNRYSIYVNDTTVASNGWLSIAPGTVLKFPHYGFLTVDGRLDAIGAADAPIYFTDYRDDAVGGDANHNTTNDAPAPNWWRQIACQGTSQVALAYCTLRYGGWNNRGIYKTGSGALSLSNCVLEQNYGNGLTAENNSTDIQIAGSTFQSNGWSGVSAAGSTLRVTNCTFRGNGTYGAWHDVNTLVNYYGDSFISNGTSAVGVGPGAITQSTAWGVQRDVSLYINDTTVASNGWLSIAPGTVLKFPHYGFLTVDGRLDAIGAADAPIYFTDYRDDAVGGDANHNTTNDAPAPNWWRQVYCQGTSQVTLAHCTVRYGGYDYQGIYKTGSGALSLSNCVVERNNYDGLVVENGSGPLLIQGCQFRYNSKGIRIASQTNEFAITGASILSNTTSGIENSGPATVDARGTWWGTPTGPYHATLNASGLGNKVSDLVLFNP